MASGRSKLSSAKSLPDLHRARMPRLTVTTPGKPVTHKNSRKPSIFPYREDQYSSKVLTGTWQERRTTDALPKVPFQEAYMLDGEPTAATLQPRKTEVTTYQKTYLKGQANMTAAVSESYKIGMEERTKNKETCTAETKDDIYHPAKDTSLHDQGAAWHSLYHQNYTLRNPKASASHVQLAAVGSPEVKYGLWERHLNKWAKIEADSNIPWKSTYMLGYPVRPPPVVRPEPEVRKLVHSLWRTEEGNLVIGNPHVEAQKELDPSVGSRHEKPAPAVPTAAAVPNRGKYNPKR